MTKAKEPNPPRPKRAGPATKTNPTTGGFQISDELWEVLEPLIPERVNTHRFGGGRPRVPDRTCANGIFYVLRTGCQWKALDATGICSGFTAHLRFQEWVAAGVFLELCRVGLERYDELKGLDWSWLSMDGAMTKSPLGGGKTGVNPTDRGKRGVKRSLLTGVQGIPVGLAVDRANRHDMKLVRVTVDSVAVSRPTPSPEHPQGLRLEKKPAPYLIRGLRLPRGAAHLGRVWLHRPHPQSRRRGPGHQTGGRFQSPTLGSGTHAQLTEPLPAHPGELGQVP